MSKERTIKPSGNWWTSFKSTKAKKILGMNVPCDLAEKRRRDIPRAARGSPHAGSI